MNNNIVYVLNMYDQWFNKTTKLNLGVFTDPEKAIECFRNNYNYDLIENGYNQWFVNKYGSTINGLELIEVELNKGC